MLGSELETLIKAGLPGADVTVKGDGDHFEAVVVSEQFEGRSMVQQHQMVYATIGNRMEG
jgi:acid stress-induced BolA-like protein IbaG/YrbA